MQKKRGRCKICKKNEKHVKLQEKEEDVKYA